MTDFIPVRSMPEGGSTSLDGDPRSNGDPWRFQFQRGEVSLQDHPVYPSSMTVGKRAALYAAGGSLCGATYAYWWGRNIPHYAASLGANYGWLGLIFHSIEFAGAKHVGVDNGTMGTHVTAGCITGAFAGGAFGGPPTAVKGAMVFACLGIGVYGIRRGWNWQYEKWRRERMQELAGNMEKNIYFEGWRKSNDKLPGQHFVGWWPEKNAAQNKPIYVGLKAGREAARAREEAVKALEGGTDDESTHSPSVLQESK